MLPQPPRGSAVDFVRFSVKCQEESHKYILDVKKPVKSGVRFHRQHMEVCKKLLFWFVLTTRWFFWGPHYVHREAIAGANELSICSGYGGFANFFYDVISKPLAFFTCAF